MTGRSPTNGAGGGRVVVRLSEVHLDLRLEAAEKIIERGALRGVDAAEIMLAAYHPRPCHILVPPEKAVRVLRERKLAAGAMPKVWTW